MTIQATKPLRRILGAPTALFIGMGVAIGSGIFRTPGSVAENLHTPGLILLAWVFGGMFVLMSGMVTAELATRFPQAGGEYVFLREAYGRFVAFFFGWAYTIFIIGGGAASIAAAFGDFGCELFAINAARWSGPLAAGAIVAVTTINALGLRTGAAAQNVLTGLKIAALATVIVIGLARGTQPINIMTATETASRANEGGFSLGGTVGVFAMLTAVVPILWAYDGTTDSVKMAEEIKDVRRALPRALIGSALALTTLYVLFNVALMRILPPDEMVGLDSVPGEAMRRIFGKTGGQAMNLVAMLVCLGSLSSTTLATIRVTFALARDGLAFRSLAKMSDSQAPIPALIVVSGFSLILVLTHRFTDVLKVYFLASAVLFGLSYASLIVLRLREKEFPKDVFRCPAGMLLAAILIVIQLAFAANIFYEDQKRAAYTLGLLAAIALFYLVWKRTAAR